MKRAMAAGVVLVIATGGGVAVLFGGKGKDAAARVEAVKAVPIVRGDLVDSEKVDGTLTYEDERQVRTGASGTVTAAPKGGAVLRRGKTLLRVNGEPVTLMYGNVPMYRRLSEGTEGPDVEQLERNLAALDYGGMTVDREFTAGTSEAVKEWQDDRGLDETGEVGVEDVVFLPGAVRVKDVKAPEGARTGSGQIVMTVSGTRRVVHVDLEAEKQELARKGGKVEVELPGGKVVPGRVSDVGTVAEKSGTGQDAKTTVDVEVTLGKGVRTTLDQAPVTVELESERHEGVLSVPVEALLALKEGGFGVEVVEGDVRKVVPVTTGAFGGGRVEIAGNVREGMKVGVPAT